VAGPNGASTDETFKTRLSREIVAAMKAREPVRLGALRLLSAAVKNREVEVGHPLSDEEFQEVALREVKRRREAIEAYRSAGREDRARKEQEEEEAISSYVPTGLSDSEIEAMVEAAIAQTGASGPGDLGKVMGVVMANAKGRVDGKAVQAKVRARLEGSA
jgi:uncharacterized protein YqeY